MLSDERKRALTLKAESMTANIDQALPYLLARGISAEVAAMFSFGYATEGDFAGRLSIPYITPGGVVAIKYRCINASHGDHKGDEHCMKYLNESGTGTHLWNAQVLLHADSQVVLTEGELDAACVQAYCGIPAVGYPGTDTWTNQPHWPLCFEGIPEVIVISDGDPQGRKAAKRVADSIGMNARVLDLPDGLDSNSFLVTQGVDQFKGRLVS